MTTGRALTADRAGAAPALRFGLFLSQVLKTWPQVLDEFTMVEELGFDHAWLVDHLVHTNGTPDDGCHEALDPPRRDRRGT